MARIRKIYLNPGEGKNYFVVDANFLANKYIPPNRTPDPKEKTRIQQCLEWWAEIDSQLNINKARVYIPDLCIAETFKVLARRYYDRWFHNRSEYSKARKRLIGDITLSDKALRALRRQIKYHDISTSRDIIISVDRFYKVFHKTGLAVELPDLVILATAKYLMDFYDIPKNRLHIVTCDRKLRDGAKKIQELPHVYDPTTPKDERSRVFKSYQPRMRGV
jgi:predicted nucleic acid-binding protein